MRKLLALLVVITIACAAGAGATIARAPAACGPRSRLSRRGILMPRPGENSRPEARHLAAQASLSAPALADPSPEVRCTMTSTFQPSHDRLSLNRRGLVVAAAGIVFGVMSQASLIEGSRDRLRSCGRAAVAGAHRTSTLRSSQPGPRAAPARRLAPHARAPLLRSAEWRSLGTELRDRIDDAPFEARILDAPGSSQPAHGFRPRRSRIPRPRSAGPWGPHSNRPSMSCTAAPRLARRTAATRPPCRR